MALGAQSSEAPDASSRLGPHNARGKSTAVSVIGRFLWPEKEEAMSQDLAHLPGLQCDFLLPGAQVPTTKQQDFPTSILSTKAHEISIRVRVRTLPICTTSQEFDTRSLTFTNKCRNEQSLSLLPNREEACDGHSGRTWKLPAIQRPQEAKSESDGALDKWRESGPLPKA